MMIILKYIKLVIKELIGIENDYETGVDNIDNKEQEDIVQKTIPNSENLENLEKENKEKDLEKENKEKDLEKENKKRQLSDYLTLQNLLYLLLFLSFIGGAYWLYNTDLINNSILESLKNLEELHKHDYHRIRASLGQVNQIYYELSLLRRLNEKYERITDDELQLLGEIRHLILKIGIKMESEEELTKKLSFDAGRKVTDDLKFKEYPDIYVDISESD